MNAVRALKVFSYVSTGSAIGGILGAAVSVVLIVIARPIYVTKAEALMPVAIGFLLGGVVGFLWGIWKTNK